jgi:hypothetical protein
MKKIGLLFDKVMTTLLPSIFIYHRTKIVQVYMSLKVQAEHTSEEERIKMYLKLGIPYRKEDLEEYASILVMSCNELLNNFVLLIGSILKYRGIFSNQALLYQLSENVHNDSSDGNRRLCFQGRKGTLIITQGKSTIQKHKIKYVFSEQHKCLLLSLDTIKWNKKVIEDPKQQLRFLIRFFRNSNNIGNRKVATCRELTLQLVPSSEFLEEVVKRIISWCEEYTIINPYKQNWYYSNAFFSKSQSSVIPLIFS